MSKRRKIIVAGGGASGMMAAITAARAGAEVTVLEYNPRLGKKLLSTGNGKCNFTNLVQDASCYRGGEQEAAWSVIGQFTAQDTVAFFTDLGIYSKNREGCLYPLSGQASAIRDVLESEIREQKVLEACNRRIRSIVASDRGFQVKTESLAEETRGKKEVWTADAVILACGSKASRISGSGEDGYELASKLGHTVFPPLPALVQLRCRETHFKALSGVRVQGRVSLYADGVFRSADVGELQLTAYGISGIPVFQVSRYAAEALYGRQKVTAKLDFMPDFSLEQFTDFLKKRKIRHSQKKMGGFLTGLFPDKLNQVLLKTARIPAGTMVCKVSEAEVERLAYLCKEFTCEVTGTNSYDQAQVCCGGVDLGEINPDTMESRLVPGLYFAGELLDVDGICGGYNLQWAWSSGYVAGRGASNA